MGGVLAGKKAAFSQLFADVVRVVYDELIPARWLHSR